jgi:hypothetical protein
LWAVGKNKTNRYQTTIIYDEDWGGDSYIEQNKGCQVFAKKYNLYKGNPRPELCEETQQELDHWRQSILESYNQIKAKISCDEVGKGGIVVIAN